MADKVVRDNSQSVPYEYWFRDQLRQSGVSTELDTVIADAIWARKKPSPLRDTSMVITEVINSPSHYTRGTKGVGAYYEGPGWYVWFDGVTRANSQSSDSGAGALNAALAGMSEFTFGETLVEAKKTANMMSKRARQLRDIGLAIKRGDRRALERLIGPVPKGDWASMMKVPGDKRLANAYNEVGYGWMPVAQAISDAARSYADGLSSNGQRVRRSRGGNRRRAGDPTTWRDYTPSSGATVSGTISNHIAYEANRHGLLNLPLEVWNKVPYSFVFDWMIPIGNYLGGITATAGLSGTNACITTETSTVWHIEYSNGRSIPRRFSRTVRRIPQLASPTLKGLSEGSAVTFGKFVSLAALLRAAM